MIQHGWNIVHQGLWVNRHGLVIMIAASLWNGMIFAMGMMAGGLFN